MDAWTPFPKPNTDGIWAGKKFALMGGRQHMGPTMEQEYDLVEVGDNS